MSEENFEMKKMMIVRLHPTNKDPFINNESNFLTADKCLKNQDKVSTEKQPQRYVI